MSRFGGQLASSVIVGMLAIWSTSVRGQGTTQTMFSFDNSGSLGAWAISAWGGQGANSAYDGSQDHTGNGGGSLHVVDDWSLGDQLVDLGWFAGSPWSQSGVIDLSQYTNVSFYIKWDTTTSTVELPTFLSTQEGLLLWTGYPNWNWVTIGSCAVPNTASNGWVKVNVPISPATPGIQTAYLLGFKKWTGTGFTGVGAFWVDDITIEGSGAPPPPPTMTMSKPTTGLNVVAATGPYNRENLASVAGESWVGHGSTPVSYSYTIKKGVDGTAGANFQNHIFLVSNPGTETSPDWNEANVIFLDMESTATGGTTWTFRYKTNQPAANSMCYDTNVVPAIINDTNIVGTWTLTFVNDTSVTMTTPSGNTTNFTIPSWLPPMFPDTVYAYFGVQANNAAAIGQQSIYSEIKITGTANPIDTVFTTADSIDTNVWNLIAVDPLAVIPVGPSARYWVSWTVPDSGFGLVTGTSLSNVAEWNAPTGVNPIQIGTSRYALISASSLPAGNVDYFSLIKRTATQLQVLLPGETNAPGTVSGKTGTPTTVSLGAGGIETVTVNSVDSTWHIVNVNGDAVHLTTTDGTATTPTVDPVLSGGTCSATILFGQLGSFTVTATNLNETWPAATSSSVTVGN